MLSFLRKLIGKRKCLFKSVISDRIGTIFLNNGFGRCYVIHLQSFTRSKNIFLYLQIVDCKRSIHFTENSCEKERSKNIIFLSEINKIIIKAALKFRKFTLIFK